MKKPIWHPISTIPFILNLSQETLDSSREQLVNMKAIKGKAYFLSDEEIQRCLKLYGEMNEDNWIFLEQCKRWLKLPLTKDQRSQVLEIETNTQELEKINEEILSLVEKYKHHTVGKIIEMNPAELAIDVMSEKIDSPFKDGQDPFQ